MDDILNSNTMSETILENARKIIIYRKNYSKNEVIWAIKYCARNKDIATINAIIKFSVLYDDAYIFEAIN